MIVTKPSPRGLLHIRFEGRRKESPSSASPSSAANVTYVSHWYGLRNIPSLERKELYGIFGNNYYVCDYKFGKTLIVLFFLPFFTTYNNN